jgi:hypothetical protein
MDWGDYDNAWGRRRLFEDDPHEVAQGLKTVTKMYGFHCEL